MSQGTRFALLTLIVLPLAILTAGCNLFCEECEECPDCPDSGSGTLGEGSPGPMIVIKKDTSTTPTSVNYYNEDTGTNLTESGDVTSVPIDNELHGIKVKDFECDTNPDGSVDAWADIDEFIGNDGSKEVRLKKTSNGLFWSYRDCCDSGTWIVLEPTEDSAYDYKIPTAFGNTKHGSLKGDGVLCDQVRLRVFKPTPAP